MSSREHHLILLKPGDKVYAHRYISHSFHIQTCVNVWSSQFLYTYFTLPDQETIDITDIHNKIRINL